MKLYLVHCYGRFPCYPPSVAHLFHKHKSELFCPTVTLLRRTEVLVCIWIAELPGGSVWISLWITAVYASHPSLSYRGDSVIWLPQCSLFAPVAILSLDELYPHCAQGSALDTLYTLLPFHLSFVSFRPHYFCSYTLTFTDSDCIYLSMSDSSKSPQGGQHVNEQSVRIVVVAFQSIILPLTKKTSVMRLNNVGLVSGSSYEWETESLQVVFFSDWTAVQPGDTGVDFLNRWASGNVWVRVWTPDPHHFCYFWT